MQIRQLFRYVRHETEKTGARKLFVVTVLFSVLSSFLTMGYFRAHKGTLVQEGMYDSFQFLGYSILFQSIALVFFSALFWYWLLSQENRWGTWGMLLTKPVPKFRWLMVKHAVFLCFFAVFVSLNAAVSFVFLLALQMEINAFFAQVYLVMLLIGPAISYSQTLFHLVVKNGILASTLSVTWIFLYIVQNNLPTVLVKWLPVFYVGFVWDGTAILPGRFVTYLLLTVLFMTAVFLVSVRKNDYTYE